jgi:argininosuccinate lyase
MAERARDGFTSATYLAERLVADGMPFRAAHHRVGETVLAALASGRSLEETAGFEGGLAPARVAAACAHGGGPGADGLPPLRDLLTRYRADTAARRERWSGAGELLDQAVREAVRA